MKLIVIKFCNAISGEQNTNDRNGEQRYDINAALQRALYDVSYHPTSVNKLVYEQVIASTVFCSEIVVNLQYVLRIKNIRGALILVFRFAIFF